MMLRVFKNHPLLLFHLNASFNVDYRLLAAQMTICTAPIDTLILNHSTGCAVWDRRRRHGKLS